MTVEFIVSMIGPDSIKIVSDVKHNTQAHGGEWLSSKFMHMDGQFSALLKIKVAAVKAEALREYFSSLPDVEVQINPVDESFDRHGHLIQVCIEGRDHLGLINEIAESLRSLDVFIVHLECNRLSVLASGENVLMLDATLNVPEGIEAEEVKDQLEALEDSLVVAVTN